MDSSTAKNGLVIVVPAYNAERTIEKTLRELFTYVEDPGWIIAGDDASRDHTAQIAATLPISLLVQPKNLGYGGNQKALYRHALSLDPRVVVMIHGDNQYDARSIPSMVDAINKGGYDLILATRMQTARKNGMPLWRYASNRFLTGLQNRAFKQNLSEYHSGMRAYSGRLLKNLPLEAFSNNFVFDSEVISWSVAHGYQLGEVPTECYYVDTVSSIGFRESLRYGLQTLRSVRDYRRGKYHRLKI